MSGSRWRGPFGRGQRNPVLALGLAALECHDAAGALALDATLSKVLDEVASLEAHPAADALGHGLAAIEGELAARGLVPANREAAARQLVARVAAGGLERLPETSARLAALGLTRADAETPRLELALLGPPRVQAVAGPARAEVTWPVRRCFELVAFVATSSGCETTRDAVVAAFWPDLEPERVRGNLNPTISHARRALEQALLACGAPPPATPILVVEGGLIRLGTGTAWRLDIIEFWRLIEVGRQAESAQRLVEAVRCYQAAWELYRGPLLLGTEASWVLPRRVAVTSGYVAMLRDLGTVLTRLDRPEEAIDAYRQSLVEAPLQETVHLALMRLYARSGRRDLVRRQFQRLSTQLFEELGSEPLAETLAEYHRLMS